MRNELRKEIRTVIAELQSGEPDWSFVCSNLEDVLDEEAEARDNTPENLQESDAYSIRVESCDLLEDAIDEIDEDDPGAAARIIQILKQIDGV